MHQEFIHLIASDFLQQLICQYSHIQHPLSIPPIIPHSPAKQQGHQPKGEAQTQGGSGVLAACQEVIGNSTLFHIAFSTQMRWCRR